MEHLDDKIIRYKIDSLDKLPVDYEPSVESKWELLENALPEKKRDNRKYILAIAASIILLLGFGGIFTQNALDQKPEIVLQNVKAGEIELPKAEYKLLPERKNQYVENNLKPENNKQKIVKNFPEINTEIIIPILKDTVFEEIIIEEILPQNEHASTSAKPKKSKKLFVEIDFNDAPKIQQKQHENLTENKLKFKVSIFKNKSRVTESTPQNTVLKISKEFPLNN